MGVNKLEIQLLDNPSLTFAFNAGQTIYGALLVVNSQELKTTGIKIRISGKTIVVLHNGRKSFKGRQDHLRDSTYIFGEGKSELEIATGTHLFPFSFLLPRNAPSSFVGQHGKIAYKLEAFIERSWRLGLTSKLAFNVNGILDLNKIPGAVQQVEKRKSKSSCCLWCKSGPISFVLRLPKSGFVPGETVNFILELSNYSSKSVTKVTVKVLQLVTYHVKKRVQFSLSSLCSTIGPAVATGEREVWEGRDLKIPQAAPSTTADCDIIKISYMLKVEMHIPGLSCNLCTTIPIFIGTVPIGAAYSTNCHEEPNSDDRAAS